jgi:hypothetical protein
MAQVRLGRFEAEEGELPPLCLRCGAAATQFQAGQVTWCPGWIYLLLLVTFWPYLIVSFLARRRITILAPFCHAHRRQWRRQRVLALVSFFVALILVVIALLMAAARTDVESIASLWRFFWVIGLFWLGGIFLRRLGAIYATELTEDAVTLNGVAEAFVERRLEERANSVLNAASARTGPRQTPQPQKTAQRRRTR